MFFFLKKNCRPILFRKKYIDKQDGKMFREKLEKKMLIYHFQKRNYLIFVSCVNIVRLWVKIDDRSLNDCLKPYFKENIKKISFRYNTNTNHTKEKETRMNKHKFLITIQSDPKDLIFPVPVRLYNIIL